MVLISVANAVFGLQQKKNSSGDHSTENMQTKVLIKNKE